MQRVVSNAASPILICVLLLDRQRLDGLGRADLAAERAVVVAIADPRHQPRRPEPFQPGLGQRGLQAAGRADLHAQPAGRAALEKLPLGPRARAGGSARHGIALPRPAGCCASAQSAATPPTRGGEHGPLRQIDRLGRRLLAPGPAPAEAQAVAAAGVGAVQAAETLRRLPALSRRGGGRAVAGHAAQVALVAACPARRAAASSGRQRAQPQQRPQRTQVAAPEPPPIAVQQQRDQEERQDQAAAEKRLLRDQRTRARAGTDTPARSATVSRTSRRRGSAW